MIAGLSLAHGRDHVFRAALEGVAHGIAHNIEVFEELGAPIDRIVAVGGGVQGGLWPQIVSDVSGREQIVPDQTVGASYGDAFLAGLASGVLSRGDLASWVRGGTRGGPRRRGARPLPRGPWTLPATVRGDQGNGARASGGVADPVAKRLGRIPQVFAVTV